MEGIEKRLVVSVVDVLDYHSILEALKGCFALFCCLDSQEGYDDKMVNLEVRGAINVVEACAQTYSIQKIVYNSSLTAAYGERIFAQRRMWMKSHGVIKISAGERRYTRIQLKLASLASLPEQVQCNEG